MLAARIGDNPRLGTGIILEILKNVTGAGITRKIDCPDLAMGRHTQFADLDLKGFRDRMALHVEALNRDVANIPAEQLRMHM